MTNENCLLQRGSHTSKAKLTPLTTQTPWWRLERQRPDIERIDRLELLRMLEQLILIRRFEERLLELSAAGLLHGPAHSSIGQEGAAVGAISILTSSDKINGTHRMHHQFLAKMLGFAACKKYSPLDDAIPESFRGIAFRTYAEILGLEPGYCGGRGGSMHLRCPEAGILGSNAIVGGNPPHAVGYALADKMLGRPDLSVAFFGDGAMQNGAVYEAMNLAALYATPTVFFVENNGYAVSTNLNEQTRETRLSARGLALGIPAIVFDGMDVIAARLAMEEARAIIACEGGPVLLEAETYRFFHQSGALRGSVFGYRTKAEEETWASRDPFLCFPKELIGIGIVEEQEVGIIEGRVAEILDEALNRLIENHCDLMDAKIRSDLWPNPEKIDIGIRGNLSELGSYRTIELEERDSAKLTAAKFVDVIAQATLRNMEIWSNLFILGEDVHRLRGGTAGATRGIYDRFPERLIGTPICENGFVGLALGSALNGMRPVIEIMYPDFALGAADQLFNQISKVRHMFGGAFPVPIIVRSRVSSGTGYGSQHSMDASGLFALYPGWRILAPSSPYDYIGMLNAAIACDDPVLVVEYDMLFDTTGPVPVDSWDFIIPIGKARIAKRGQNCTILAYGPMVKMTCAAAANVGVDAEVIDLRTIDPLGLDWMLIEESVRKTNTLMIAERNARGTSVGARIANEAQLRLFDWLDHEIIHITGAEAAPVVSKTLEKSALADTSTVESALRQLETNATKLPL